MHIKGFPVEKKTTTKKTTILNEAAAKIKIKLYQGNQLWVSSSLHIKEVSQQ